MQLGDFFFFFLQARVCVFTMFYGGGGRTWTPPQASSAATDGEDVRCGETERTFGSPRTPSCPPSTARRAEDEHVAQIAVAHALLFVAGRAFTRPGPGGLRCGGPAPTLPAAFSPFAARCCVGPSRDTV